LFDTRFSEFSSGLCGAGRRELNTAIPIARDRFHEGFLNRRFCGAT
jgi:hypothetical protein